MTFKTLLPLLFFSLMISSLNSCKESNDLKVGFIYNAKSQERFTKESLYFAERMKSLGVKTIIQTAENNNELQIERGISLLDEGVQLLVIIAVNGNTIAPLVREAKDRGIPVIAYNRLINNVDYDLFLTGDNADLGRIMAETVLKLKPTGNYIHLAGDRFDRNGTELKTAIDKSLKPYIDKGDIKLIYESYIENWSGKNAQFELDEIIKSHGTDIDAVISGYDGMTQGVINTLKKYGLEGKVITTGQDAEPNAIKNIHDGYQHVTIYHPSKKLGYEAADAAFALLKGKTLKNKITSNTFNGLTQIPTIQVKSIEINAENLEETIFKAGIYKKEDIFK